MSDEDEQFFLLVRSQETKSCDQSLAGCRKEDAHVLIFVDDLSLFLLLECSRASFSSVFSLFLGTLMKNWRF